jgi:hypothetical protein
MAANGIITINIQQELEDVVMKITATHKEILEDGAKGFCYRGIWKWISGGKPVTREVNTLLRAKLLSASYYCGGEANAYITELGKRVLAN